MARRQEWKVWERLWRSCSRNPFPHSLPLCSLSASPAHGTTWALPEAGLQSQGNLQAQTWRATQARAARLEAEAMAWKRNSSICWSTSDREQSFNCVEGQGNKKIIHFSQGLLYAPIYYLEYFRIHWGNGMHIFLCRQHNFSMDKTVPFTELCRESWKTTNLLNIDLDYLIFNKIKCKQTQFSVSHFVSN